MPNIPTVNEKLLQRYIRHSIYLEQLKKSEARYISQFLGKEVFPSLREKLIENLGKIKGLETLGSIRKIPAKRLTRMMLAVRKTAQAGAVKAEKMLVGRLMNISRFEADWNADIIEKTVPLDIDMTLPSNEVLRNLVTQRPFEGHKLSTWMAGYFTVVQRSMAKQIKVGIAMGESLPAIGARINKALNWKGKQAQYIARTAVSSVVHNAKEEVFKKNTDIVRKVQWVSTLDDRTSMECIHLDGRMFDVGDGPRPPIHFNCRSSVIPITPSWQEFGIEDPPPATRASMNGAVPAKMTYKQWLKEQGKTAKGRAVQVKVLGKTRAELYRKGKVKIDRFVGKDLKPLTLKQLAKREGLDLAPALPPAPPVTVSKVKIIFTKTTSKEFQDIVTKQIDSYPEKVKLALNKQGITFNVGNKLTEMYPELKGRHPRGWPPGTTWDSVDAIYKLDKKMISVSETYRPIRQKVFVKTSKGKIKGLLNHETGHGLNHSISGDYSNSGLFKSAYRKDLKAISSTDIYKNDLRYFLQKGMVGRDETFAEVFSNIMGQGGQAGDIRKFFPNCTKYVDDILKAKATPVVKPKVKISKIAVAPAPKPTTINVYKGVKTGKLYADDATLKLRKGKLFNVKTGEEVILDQAASRSARLAPAPPPSIMTKEIDSLVKEYIELTVKDDFLNAANIATKLKRKGISGIDLHDLVKQRGIPITVAKKHSLVVKKPVKNLVPNQVETVPTKGTGVLLSRAEKAAIKDYSVDFYEYVKDYQLGISVPKHLKIPEITANIESGLAKLSGYRGTTYRGLAFSTDAARAKFINSLKEGSIWSSKTFQSSTKSLNVARQYAGDKSGVILHIKGVSSRDITELAGFKGEKEFLFNARTPFKVVKIKDNEVWLEEVMR